MAKSSVLQHYAQFGGAARAEQLRAELAAIEQAFPGLTRRGPGRPAVSVSPEDGAPAITRKRTRAPMTAAQKRAVGVRMKKYWAARRKADAKQS
jgi:hypothetical protein